MIEQSIEQFHRSGRRCVVAITGGGSRLIGDLLSVPGGSVSVLEAIVPYSEQALAEFLKQAPDQYCSRETALAMAAAALHRARQLVNGRYDQLVGLGITASLASSRPKRGAHRAFLAMQTETETALNSIVLAKGERTRVQEEDYVGRCGLNLLIRSELPQAVESAGSEFPGDGSHWESAIAEPGWRAVRTHEQPYVVYEAGCQSSSKERPSAVLSGSFNPRHHGHDRLRESASEFLGADVGFECTIVNADKPPIDDLTLRSRLQQFREPVVLTNAATFAEKSRVLPRTTFVVGVDTAIRILDRRFYRNGSIDDALATLKHQECQFVVAARHDQGEVVALKDIDLPDQFADLFVELPADRFLEDVSSTEIRNQ